MTRSELDCRKLRLVVTGVVVVCFVTGGVVGVVIRVIVAVIGSGDVVVNWCCYC